MGTALNAQGICHLGVLKLPLSRLKGPRTFMCMTCIQFLTNGLPFALSLHVGCPELRATPHVWSDQHGTRRPLVLVPDIKFLSVQTRQLCLVAISPG